MHNAEIGSEISGDVESDVLPQPPRNRRRTRRTEAPAPEYPPPMPSITRTEDNPSHVPWVMRKYYSGDGRLVIREEKVKHHEYFQVERSNGRLMVNLVPLDDDVEDGAGGEREETVADGKDDGICDPTAEESVSQSYAYKKSSGANNCGGFSSPEAFMPPVRT